MEWRPSLKAFCNTTLRDFTLGPVLIDHQNFDSAFKEANFKMLSDGIMFSSLIATGFLWGITNPFLKIGTEGVEKILEPNKFKRTIKELYFLVTNWKYILPFLANQCGSVLFLYTLQSADLTLANPITNSLAFVFTFVGGWLLGEETPDKQTIIGMVLIIGGILCYVLDKLGKDSVT